MIKKMFTDAMHANGELIRVGLIAGLFLVVLFLALANARGHEPQVQAPAPSLPPVTAPNKPPGQRTTRPGFDEPPAPPAPTLIHTVARGETLAEIALRYRVPFEQIAVANGITDHNVIKAGHHLVIQPRPAGVEVIDPGSTLSGLARRHGLSVRELAALNPRIADPNRILAGGSVRVGRR